MILRGWKEISAVLAISTRTARRLATAHGLPVAYIGKSPTTTEDVIARWIEESITRQAKNKS